MSNVRIINGKITCLTEYTIDTHSEDVRNALIELGWTPPKYATGEPKSCVNCGVGNKVHDLPTIECDGCGPMTSYHKWTERPEEKDK